MSPVCCVDSCCSCVQECNKGAPPEMGKNEAGDTVASEQEGDTVFSYVSLFVLALLTVTAILLSLRWWWVFSTVSLIYYIESIGHYY